MFRTLACITSLSLLSTAALAAEGQDKAGAPSQEQSRDAGAAAQPAASSEGKAQSDAAAEQGEQDPTRAFIKEAYSSNLFEVQLGELAAQRAQDDQVKQFARSMVADHTKANEELKRLGQSGDKQTSERLDAVHQAKLQKMQRLPASEFDRKYIFSQVAGHTMNVLEFRYQSQNAQDQQVKQYATQTLPKLEQHLQHANKIAKQQGGGEAGTAAGRLGAEQARPGEQQDSQGTSSTSDQRDRSGGSSTDGTAGQATKSGQSDGAAKDASGQKSE
jgi:putative membrane protein